MFLAILLRLLALAGIALGPTGATASGDEVVTTPREAQLRLARMLGDADSIDAVTANGRAITFAIAKGDDAMRLVAMTRANGTVVSLAITHTHAPVFEPGPVTWLASELAEAKSIVRLEPDEDGAVTITTNDDRRYMIIPGRGSGGPGANEAVEARWAAEWNRPAVARR